MPDDVEVPKPAGAPAWTVTFADLMSLLLCFFVLLLSFAEMDARKFRALADTLKSVLGSGPPLQVMVEVPVPVAVESAAPATGEATTTETGTEETGTEETGTEPSPADTIPPTPVDPAAAQTTVRQIEQQETETLAHQLAAALAGEIARNEIELEAKGRTVTLRIREQGSFASGSDAINAGYVPVLARIRELLLTTDAQLQVSGHTDDQPIETERFRSNWELSAARAVSVAHELLKDPRMPANRIAVSGHADTRPLDSNASEAGRSRNRRVEILIIRTDPPPKAPESE